MRSREHPRDNAGGFSFVSLLLNVIAREVVVIYARVRPVRRCPKFARTPSIPALRPIDARRPAMTTTTERVVVVDIRPSVRSSVRARGLDTRTNRFARSTLARRNASTSRFCSNRARCVVGASSLSVRVAARSSRSISSRARRASSVCVDAMRRDEMDGWMDSASKTDAGSRNAYEIVFVFVGDDDGGDNGGVRRSRGWVFAVARVGFGRAGGRSSSSRSSSR